MGMLCVTSAAPSELGNLIRALPALLERINLGTGACAERTCFLSTDASPVARDVGSKALMGMLCATAAASVEAASAPPSLAC